MAVTSKQAATRQNIKCVNQPKITVIHCWPEFFDANEAAPCITDTHIIILWGNLCKNVQALFLASQHGLKSSSDCNGCASDKPVVPVGG